jgi:hypothetical protein
MTNFLSQAAQNIISLMNCRSDRENVHHFPLRAWNGSDTRNREGDNLRQWFLRVAKSMGGPESLLINDNLALILMAKTKDKNLYYVNIQSIAVEKGSILDFCNDETLSAQYLRLELDFAKPGPFFKEPLPHIHTTVDGPPRIPMITTTKQTLIVDFIEFLFVNFNYPVWLEWARSVWQNSPHYLMDDDSFDAIVYAYKSGHADLLLKRYPQGIDHIRNALMAEKRHLAMKHACLPDKAKLLSY